MRALIAFAVALCLGVGAAVATDITTQWAGVYKFRFQNALVSGEEYESENVLEVVRLDTQSAYVRAHLEFANGHSCSLYVVMNVEGDRLVYREPNPPTHRRQCIVTLDRENGEMVIDETEESQCGAAHCGARGSLRDQRLPVSSQRRIRYMERLRASVQFDQAMREAGRTP
ncbi:MAG: hypothetical protein R3C27_08805 [Hyphomonadaceae bacterium]